MDPNKQKQEIVQGMDLAHSIHRAGGLRTRGGRLPPISVRGLVKTKKTFAPSIPQRRNVAKVESQEVKTKTEIRGASKRGRGRGRGGRQFIQTTGALFGAGVGMNPLKKNYRDSNYSKAEAGLTMPVFKAAKLKTKKELEADENFLKLEQSDEEYSDDETEPKHKVVNLPLACKTEVKAEDAKSIFRIQGAPLKTECVSQTEPKVEIKQEPVDEDNIKPDIKEEKFDIKSDLGLDFDELFLLQLPERLPFEVKTDDSKKNKSNGQDEKAESDEKVGPGCTLSELNEGLIGKLQILENGEVRLVLGGIPYTLHLEDNAPFYQELITITQAEEEDANPQLTVLCPIKKMVSSSLHIDELTETLLKTNITTK